VLYLIKKTPKYKEKGHSLVNRCQ